MALPCIVCSKKLDDVFVDEYENQPYSGLAFVTYGHYGSTYFDPMDGSKLELNVCDTCIKNAVRDNKAIHICKNNTPSDVV